MQGSHYLSIKKIAPESNPWCLRYSKFAWKRACFQYCTNKLKMEVCLNENLLNVCSIFHQSSLEFWHSVNSNVWFRFMALQQLIPSCIMGNNENVHVLCPNWFINKFPTPASKTWEWVFLTKENYQYLMWNTLAIPMKEKKGYV